MLSCGGSKLLIVLTCGGLSFSPCSDSTTRSVVQVASSPSSLISAKCRPSSQSSAGGSSPLKKVRLHLQSRIMYLRIWSLYLCKFLNLPPSFPKFQISLCISPKLCNYTLQPYFMFLTYTKMQNLCICCPCVCIIF